MIAAEDNIMSIDTKNTDFLICFIVGRIVVMLIQLRGSSFPEASEGGLSLSNSNTTPQPKNIVCGQNSTGPVGLA